MFESCHDSKDMEILPIVLHTSQPAHNHYNWHGLTWYGFISNCLHRTMHAAVCVVCPLYANTWHVSLEICVPHILSNIELTLEIWLRFSIKSYKLLHQRQTQLKQTPVVVCPITHETTTYRLQPSNNVCCNSQFQSHIQN